MHHSPEPVEEVAHCAVEIGGVRHSYSSVTPQREGNFESQLREALVAVDEAVRQEAPGGFLCQQTLFLADMADAEPCRAVLSEFYGPDMPATTLVPQRPCSGAKVAVEAIGLAAGSEPVQVQRLSPQIVTVRHGDNTWTYIGQVTPRDPAAKVYQQSRSAFEQLGELLAQAGRRWEQVVRTWLYLGGIVDEEDGVERYRELNRARTDAYEPYCFGGDRLAPSVAGAVYPASTGIGADNRSVLVGCVALESQRSDLLWVPLENPLQVSAFDYAPKYGVKSPKFARAMAVTYADCATIFISGTASITDSESRHIGDPAAQTRQTLENIAALIGEANFRDRGLSGYGATLADLASLRVYVKRPEDYAAVRATCEAMTGKAPTIYTVADVCRPELLVEIEGMAFAQRKG